MASFFNLFSAGRFGKAAPKTPTAPQTDSQQTQPQLQPHQAQQQISSASSLKAASSSSNLTAPILPQTPVSPPPTSGNPLDRSISSDNMQTQYAPRRLPFYFREENSNLIVKGNFMTLAAKPEHVDKGEWLAHQLVEQYRILEANLKVLQEQDPRTKERICNPRHCPQMTAPANAVYTWSDNAGNQVRIPASQYIELVQKWVMSKISNQKSFPTDTFFIQPTPTSTYPSNSSTAITASNQPIAAAPTSLTDPLSKLSGQDRDWIGKAAGFPDTFFTDVRSMYRQMFRCYAHIYQAHWLEPFYHVGLSKELNTCFVHFVNVGRQFELLSEHELLPMKPLVDIWVAKELLPAMPNQVQVQPAQILAAEQVHREVAAAGA